MDRVANQLTLPDSGLPVSGFLEVGPHLIDCGALRVVSREPPLRLPPKALAVLVELARRPGQTVSRDQLLDAAWAATSPTPDVVKQAILELRRALEPSPDSTPIIETIPRVGYRLVAPCVYFESAPTPLPGTPPPAATNDEATAPGPAPARADPLVPPSQTAAPRWRARVWAVGLAAVIAGMAMTLRGTGPVPVAMPGAVAAATSAVAPLLSYRLLTSDLGAEAMPAVSPDGLHVAYSAGGSEGDWRLGVKDIDGSGPLWIGEPGNDWERLPIWSPDGSELAFQRLDPKAVTCRLVIRPLVGGAERRVADCSPRGMQRYDWSPNGETLAISQILGEADAGRQLLELSLAGGAASVFPYDPSASTRDLDPRYSPDGRQVAFRRGSRASGDLFVFDRVDGGLRQLTRFGAALRGLAWTPSGRHLIVSSNHRGPFALYAVDAVTGAVTDLGVSHAEDPSVARRAPVLAFSKTRVTRHLLAVDLGAGAIGAPKPAVAPGTGSDWGAVLAPQDGQVAFISDRTGQDEVWIAPASGAQPFVLSRFSGERLSQLEWSPDGQRLLVVAARDDLSRLFEIDVARRIQVARTGPGLVVRQAVHGGKDEIWAIARSEDGEWRLWRGRTRAEGLWTLEPTPLPAQMVRYDDASGGVILQRAGYFELARHGGDLAPLPALKVPGAIMHFRVRAGAAWVLYNSLDSVGLAQVDLATGETRVMREGLPADWQHPQFDASADGSHVVVAGITRDDTDVAVATLPDWLH